MVKITENSLRDGHQSLLATRMRTEDLVEAAKALEKVGFYSVEVWGGATYDTCLRYLKEDPFERLAAFKEVFKTTKLQMLLRGQNLVGYRHYADDVVNEFVRLSAEGGIDIFRIFDALNDIRNVTTAIEAVKKEGKHAQGAISYTVSPVHTLQMYVDYAKELVSRGCDSIAIKDMAGLMHPYDAYNLVKSLKKNVKVPIQYHSHSTAGFAFGAHLKAVEAGADMLDLCNSALAEGTSHPCTQSMIATLKGTTYDTGLDLAKMEKAAEILREKRDKYRKYESKYNLVDTRVLVSQIPGGMFSNLANQLREQDALHRMDDVMQEIARVREDFGYPPLVTPSSQIVGTQAVLNVLMSERYKNITKETRNYVKGLYGKPVGKINPNLIKLALRDEEEPITCRPADLIEPELEKAYADSKEFARKPSDVISYVLFGDIAKQYLVERNTNTLNPESLAYVEEGADKNVNVTNKMCVTVHGETFEVDIEGVGKKSDEGRLFFVRVNGEQKEVFVESEELGCSLDAGGTKPSKSAGVSSGGLPAKSQQGHVTPTMPGNLINIKVNVGDTVKAGDTVAVVEAMKMENDVLAPIDGEVVEIYAEVGIQVTAAQAVMLIE